MILLKRLPVAGYCDWTFEVGRQSRVGALEVQQKNQLCKIFSKKKICISAKKAVPLQRVRQMDCIRRYRSAKS